MSKKKPVRNKQLARQKAARARRAAEAPLRHLQPPFAPYSEWIEVPAEARGLTEYPLPPQLAAEMEEDERDFLNRVVRLSPLYNGAVPMAAVYLDKFISADMVPVAVTGQPGQVNVMSVQAMASGLSDQREMDRMREEHPEADLPTVAVKTTVEDCARSLHKLHAHGYVVLDDDHVLHFARPPKAPGGTWLLSGHAPAE